HQHFVFTHRGGQVVAGPGQLGFVGDEQQAAREDLLQLLLVDRLVPEHLARQAPLLHVTEAVEVAQGGRAFEGSERYVLVVIHGSDSQVCGWTAPGQTGLSASASASSASRAVSAYTSRSVTMTL